MVTLILDSGGEWIAIWKREILQNEMEVWTLKVYCAKMEKADAGYQHIGRRKRYVWL